jgi:hypothetical protein
VRSWYDELADAGLLTTFGAGPDARVVLTRPGRLMANDVTARLLAALEALLPATAPVVPPEARRAPAAGTR